MMKNLEELGEVISTDVLVIGGGLAGLTAGIKIKENQTNVLVVDKGGIGWTGQAPTGGGMFMVIFPEDDLDQWVKWVVEDGEYLNNQDWTYAYGGDTYKCFREAVDWGLPFIKNDTGEVGISTRLEYYKMVYWESDKVMLKLKQVALSQGVKTLDKVAIVDLLRVNGRVVGAIGFGLVDSKIYIFKSKATIIANGQCSYRAAKFHTYNTGEGIAMAYRAGAELINAEFANSYIYVVKDYGVFRREIMHLFFINSIGERILEKHYPELMSGKAAGDEVIDAMAKEVMAGYGPIRLDLSQASAEQKEDIAHGGKGIDPVSRSWLSRALFKDIWRLLQVKGGISLDKDKVEFIPVFTGGGGPIRIDLDCRTTVEGLWAAGDAGISGGSYTGAQTSQARCGRGFPFAMVSGARAGQSAAVYAKNINVEKIDYDTVKHQISNMLAPLSLKHGIEPHKVICQVQEAVLPLKYNFYREGGKLKEALKIVELAKENLSEIKANDYHELYNYHRAEAMAKMAELTLRAALMREESRGVHRREDYPHRDDENWLKWIVIQEKDSKVKFRKEDVPIEKYKFKP
jgi:succinate dehydrogenase/fumarate reductase flavoprotein subunit